MWLPWFIVSGLKKSTDEAENILGHPPNAMEVFAYSLNKRNFPFTEFETVYAALLSMVREDMLFTDANCYRFSSTPKRNYYSYTQLF